MNIYQYIRDVFLLLIASLLVTIITCAAKFDEMMSGSGLYIVILPVVLLIIYGGISYRIPAFALKDGLDTAIKNGTLFGVISGIIWIVNLSVEHLVNSAGNMKTILSMVMMILIFALYWISAFRTILKSGKIPASLFAAVWSAMTGVLVLFVYGFVLYFISHAKMESNLQTAFTASGMHDLTSFVIINILQSGTTHLIVAPIISVIFGATAVLINQISNKLKT